MAQPSADSERDATLAALAARFDFSVAAVHAMSVALTRGDQRMAQFDHPEFGGHGQWMRGGMLMIGDMFNDGLKARVAGLCEELVKLPGPNTKADPVPNISHDPLDTSNDWWPRDLGRPNSSGAQNDIRYAYFAGAHRLAVDRGGAVTVFDTGDHDIFGVAQQQSDSATITFSSQNGPVDITELTRI